MLHSVILSDTSRPHECGESGVCIYREFFSWSQLGRSWRHVGHLGANIGSKRPPHGAPQAVQIASGAILAPRGRLKAQPPKMAIIFPQNCKKHIVFHNKNEPHGILHRIYRIQRKRNMRCGTDPGFPTPGARMTVVYTNSLKPG